MTDVLDELGFACPTCGRATRVPPSFAGRRGRCPRCREWVAVPGPGEEPLPPLPAEDPRPDDARPCPACGEPIRAAAKKCRHCGEFVVKASRRGRPAPQTAPPGLSLAGHGPRLAAFLIDEPILRWAPVLALLVSGIEQDAPILVGAALAYQLAISVVQWVLIWTRGQTLGKLALGLRIVRTDGAPVGFVHGVALRCWTLGLFQLPEWHFLAALVLLVDGAFALGAARTCLHDVIADTRVVTATPAAPAPVEA